MFLLLIYLCGAVINDFNFAVWQLDDLLRDAIKCASVTMRPTAEGGTELFSGKFEHDIWGF